MQHDSTDITKVERCSPLSLPERGQGSLIPRSEFKSPEWNVHPGWGFTPTAHNYRFRVKPEYENIFYANGVDPMDVEAGEYYAKVHNLKSEEVMGPTMELINFEDQAERLTAIQLGDLIPYGIPQDEIHGLTDAISAFGGHVDEVLLEYFLEHRVHDPRKEHPLQVHGAPVPEESLFGPKAVLRHWVRVAHALLKDKEATKTVAYLIRALTWALARVMVHDSGLFWDNPKEAAEILSKCGRTLRKIAVQTVRLSPPMADPRVDRSCLRNFLAFLSNRDTPLDLKEDVVRILQNTGAFELGHSLELDSGESREDELRNRCFTRYRQFNDYIGPKYGQCVVKLVTIMIYGDLQTPALSQIIW